MTDIFISYASADLPRVKPLVDALVQRGWSVWWDRSILAGKRFDEVIEAALNDARCVIVLWSKNSVQSDWVRTEAEEARQRRILVPALLDDVKIPLAFRGIQTANLVDWPGTLPSAQFDELVRAVSAVLPPAAPRVQAATPQPTRVEPAPQDKDRASAARKAEEDRRAKEEEAERIAAQRAEEWRLAHERAAVANKTGDIAPARSSRLILPAGGLALACIAGLVWYFATHPRVSASPAAKQLPSLVQADPSVDPATNPDPNLPGVQRRKNPKDGLTYVWIPPGKFTMGCSQGDSACDLDEKPAHPVNISKGFWMGETEVTQDAYQKVTGKNPSRFKGAQRPVEEVNWNEASEYCGKVALRLPTEAEWEYAARAGSEGARYGDLDKVAWYNGNSGGETKPVHDKQPSSWGLYDMLGNVWEWTADWYGEKYYDAREATDPLGPKNGGQRVLRGGSWSIYPRDVRASLRIKNEPWYRDNDIGFRCAGELR